MRILVCGGRNYENWYILKTVLDNFKCPDMVVIEGGAAGADLLAKMWAQNNGIPCKTFFAEWKDHGRRAGPIRNKQMLVEGKPDLVIAFPGGKGTANMVKQAEKAGVEIFHVKE